MLGGGVCSNRFVDRRSFRTRRARLSIRGASMPTNSDDDTSLTLMMRIQKTPADPRAWDDFIEHYRPMIETWCRTWGLQASDVDDVTQDVLLKLLAAIEQFQYDPSRSFRSWLKTVTQHALTDFSRARKRRACQLGGKLESLADSSDALADLEKKFEGAFDAELLEMAMKRAEKRVKPRNWQAFQLTTIEGLSGAEAAARLEMPVAQLYVAKNRVQKLLQEEILNLRGE
jgi:RNA polymerase sigma factor (sigma-70 family)